MVKRRKTRDVRVWLQYGCWCVQNWMSKHTPGLPVYWRCRLLNRFDVKRHMVSQAQYEFWLRQGHDATKLPRPLPWWVGPGGQGPFVAPWRRLAKLLRAGTGGRSHRCEFTDPEHGALYGHREGAFMDALFDAFVEKISAD